MRLHVTLSSSASKEHFPQNTLARFTNVLRRPIYPSGDKSQLYARVKSIALSSKVPGVTKESPRAVEDPHSHFVRIHIRDLDPATTTDDRSIAHFPFPPKTLFRDGYAFHEFEHEPYFLIRANPIHQFSIILTNSVNEPVDLYGQLATIVQLEISDMRPSGQFTVTCASHSKRQLELYPQNTLSSFIVSLPQEFSLKGWQVALVGISYPPVTASELRLKFIFPAVQEDEEKYFTLTYNVHDFSSSEDFLKQLMEDMAENRTIGRHIMIDPLIDGRISWRNISGERVILLLPNNAMKTVLGFHDHVISAHIPHTRGWNTPRAVDLHRYTTPPSVGFLYADCVEQSVVGDAMRPLLQMIPLGISARHENERHFVYQPEHLIYHEMIDRPFNTIRFTIAHLDGDPYNVDEDADDTVGTQLTLSFRPRRDDDHV